MPMHVLLLVLFAALLHALWNALVRSSSDKLHATLLIVWGSGAFSAAMLPFLSLPAVPSWPYLGASVLIHVAYFSLLAFSYHQAELSLAYPLMRGTAPALTALAAALLLQESPSAAGWSGIALISGGVLLLAAGAWRAGTLPGHTVLPALGNALVIAAYTLVDGQGVRLSGQALSYTGWIFLLTAPLMLGVALSLRGRAVVRRSLTGWRIGLLGGACTLASYSLALWAMVYAPIASVAALRETSIVFAALLGWLFLKERISHLRHVSIFLVCAGAVAIKLG
jgi:drug/metabolite transporter (DMT)-like permease